MAKNRTYRKIILIALDTLRADHLGAYGYRVAATDGKGTSPFIDVLADQGVLFRNHYATDVPTPGSFTSLFYGVRGITHGVLGFNNPNLNLPSTQWNLAQHFFDAGFRTGMISNLLYKGNWYAKGFYDIRVPGGRFQGGTAEEVTDLASRWIHDHAKENYFLFVHYWDPHVPYLERSHCEFRALFNPQMYGEIAPDMTYFDNNEALKIIYQAKHRWDNDPLPPDENLALYDANIRYLDASLQQLFEHLSDEGVLNDTLIIITSDHGETFGEYGFWDHYNCSNPVSRLPLLVIGPHVAQNQVRDYTQNIDVMPTLLEAAGIKHSADLEGSSLFAYLLGGESSGKRREAAVNSDATIIQRLFVFEGKGLVHTLSSSIWNHVQSFELYDLERDPNQVLELSKSEPLLLDDMKLRYFDWLVRELRGRADPLQFSVSQGGWMWPDAFGTWLSQRDVARLCKLRPELRRVAARAGRLSGRCKARVKRAYQHVG